MTALKLQTIIISVVVLAFSLDTPACVKAQQVASAPSRKGKASVMSRQEEMRVQEAADRFVTRFRETLDFGAVFDETFAADSIRRLRRAGFFKGMNLSPQLIDSLEDPALERAYKAFMNYYYLKAVYDLGVGKSDSTPPEVAAALRTSKFSNLLSDEGNGDSMVIATRQELDEFVSDLSNVTALYKGHLSRSVFDSTAYKAGLKAINKQRRTLQIRDGYESLGVGKGTKVYEVEKDIFTFFFIEENGQIKVLTLGMGN